MGNKKSVMFCILICVFKVLNGYGPRSCLKHVCHLYFFFLRVTKVIYSQGHSTKTNGRNLKMDAKAQRHYLCGITEIVRLNFGFACELPGIQGNKVNI